MSLRLMPRSSRSRRRRTPKGVIAGGAAAHRARPRRRRAAGPVRRPGGGRGRRLVEPARHRFAQHALAFAALAGDDQHAAPALGLGAGDEGGEFAMRLVLGLAMEIEPRLDRHLAALQLLGSCARSIPAPWPISSGGEALGDAAAVPRRGGTRGRFPFRAAADIRRRLRLDRAVLRRASPRANRSLSSRLVPASAIVDQHDMEPARPVRAELEPLLDIAGARRAGDEIDRARHGRAAVRSAHCGAQPVPAVLVGRRPPGPPRSTTICVSGRKLLRVGRSGPGISISVPVSATAAKQAVTPTASPSSARPRRISQQRPLGPGNVVERGSGVITSSRRQIVLRRDSRATASGTSAQRGDPRHRGLRLLGHGDEERRSGRHGRALAARAGMRLRRCAASRARSCGRASASSSGPRCSERRMPARMSARALAHLARRVSPARPTGCESCGPRAPAGRAPRSSRRPRAGCGTGRAAGRPSRAPALASPVSA